MDDKALEKIKKCLSLASSGNEYEAAQAVRAAQALMRKYGVGHDDIAFMEMGKSISQSKVQAKPTSYIASLANVIASAFGVKPILTWDCGNKIQFIGEYASAQVAGYSFDVCVRQLSIARKEYISTLHKNCKRQTKTRRADSFCDGWVFGVSRNLPVMDMEDEQSDLVDRYYSREVGEIKEAKVTDRATDKELGNYYDGLSEGKDFSVHAPVGGESEQILLN